MKQSLFGAKSKVFSLVLVGGNCKMDKSVLDEILRQVSKPVRYMGNEYNRLKRILQRC